MENIYKENSVANALLRDIAEASDLLQTLDNLKLAVPVSMKTRKP